MNGMTDKHLKALIDLQDRLGTEKYVFDGLHNKSHAVYYDGKPEVTQEIQNKVDKATEFIHIIYIYAILDGAGFIPKKQAKLYAWIPQAYLDEFKAWAHIRHTGAHTPNGRARSCAKEFNAFINAHPEFERISGYDTDTNTINPQAGGAHRFFEFVKKMVQQAIVDCGNELNN
ncbi:hypothetical protein [Vibrio bivalvicida]|uniref:Uncharacterized protein n=1 Tax=Vibrio bivalvicida TaxID=1276888 RepID=A0A177XWZ6_9VIBR|nr:hypothetical protein [Vibrio bivalvicida]OAJ92795.1 hypothetical protein APB76_18160 [Vibrio bivalvicida]